jgi:hypothetical protein
VLRSSLVAGLFLASVCGCGESKPASFARGTAAGGPSSRIEERSLSDRPPLAIIARSGDPEGALAFASLASGAPEIHATFGEILRQRLTRAGYQADIVTHGLGFELMLLVENAERARTALAALLAALGQPIAQNELGPRRAAPVVERSAVEQCSGELANRRATGDASELERERKATFARDRTALAVVGDAELASAAASALSAGPDWPELGNAHASLPAQGGSQVLRGDRPALSLGFTASDPNRALRAAAELVTPDSALALRLAALPGGFKLRRVTATAHPSGACLRVDSDVDASPVPEARRLGFAVQLITEEAERALATPADGNRLEDAALSATDPRLAARAAAYGALVHAGTDVPAVRVVALSAPDDAPTAPSIEAAAEQASREAAPLEPLVRVESGQPGVWALLASPCATTAENAESAGHAAALFTAAAQTTTPGVRLEPWLGAPGAGILGYTERAAGETDAQAAERLGNALGRAVLAPPSALAVAEARAELVRSAGTDARPLLDALVETLAPGHAGALAPRGSATSLQTASREAVLARQRDLLRAPHRLAILSATNAADAALVARSAARWLKTPDAPRPSPCATEISAPARGELGLAAGLTSAEGGYVAYRIPAKFWAEASVLADVLSANGGPLARSMAEPDLVGAARASLLGTSSARALVVQLSAFDGRENEALGRAQRLFERLDGVLASAEIEAALKRLREQRRLAALDPRYRLVELLDPSVSAPVDAASVKRLALSLRPDAAVVARAKRR